MPASVAPPHSGGTSRAGWIVCLLLLLALGVTSWYAWKQGMTPAQSQAPPQEAAPPNEELARLRKTIQELEAVRADLQALLQADPCSIPEEIHGLPLTLADPAPAVPSAPPAQPDPPGQVSRPAPGDVRVVAESKPFKADNNEIEAATTLILSAIGTGTGFFVAPGIVATNRHVVEGSPDILLLNKTLGGLTKGKVIALSQEEERDYALVRIDPGSRSLPEPLPLCGSVKKADKVASWGFPGAVSGSDPKFQALMRGDLHAIPEEVYSEGVVNVVYETAPPMIMHTATTSHGNSGGPLVNTDGCVVGISTMISRDQQSYRQTSIALASGDLAAFLWQHGINPRYSRGGK